VPVQQAIFTSVRSGRNEGYQLCGVSPGISSEEARELAQWGPGHDALYSELAAAESANYHRLQSGVHCVSQTVLAGREYSGRGGHRTYTQMFLVPDELLRRFGCNPFRVLEALVVSGRCSVLPRVPSQLETIELVGRASLVNQANLERVLDRIDAYRLSALVQAALTTSSLGICAAVGGKRLLTALVDLLPPQLRTDFSWTTALRVSGVRPYRLAMLPADKDMQRRAVRQTRLELLDVRTDPPSKFVPDNGWPQLVHRLLRHQQYATLADVMRTSLDGGERDPDLLAELQSQRLERAAPAISTPFPA
jgi:hypothetical protein